MIYHWLSFWDTNLPKSEQFQGILVTEAATLSEALQKSWLPEMRPGWQAAFSMVTLESPLIISTMKPYLDKLLSKKQAMFLAKWGGYKPLLNQ